MTSRARAVAAAGLIALASFVAGCGGHGPSAGPPADARSSAAQVERAGRVRFHDAAVGITGAYPAGWHRARAVTNFADPREVLVLASYPLRGGAKAGECAPDHARADMPPGGTFVWLLEYRPLRGDVWAELERSRFPAKPADFRLERAELGESVSCFPGPGYSTTFRAADRPFQLLVAFGGRPMDAQLDEVAKVLSSLEFEPLPAPPPDPYAGWPLVNDNSGDSVRPPRGWAAAAARYAPGETPRPRALFFASNRPLAGLPAKLVPFAELPGSMPEGALANDFPADGVLVWVVEERRTEDSASFRPIDRTWPSRDDFEAAPAPVSARPDVRWLRTSGAFRGYRFSVWIAIGPRASRDDRELAFKSAASLAVSGCWRDAIDDCPDA